MFTLILSYDDGQLSETLKQCRVSSSAVRALPDQKRWATDVPKYEYIFDKHDERNATTIFLTTPETHAERTLRKKKVKHDAVPYEPPKFDSDKRELFEHDAWVEIVRYIRIEGMFSYVCTDEATKIKTVGSKRHLATQLLKAPRYIFMSATPMMNRGTVS
jgi:hypothetical protein